MSHEAIYRQQAPGNLYQENSFIFQISHYFPGDSKLKLQLVSLVLPKCSFLVHALQLVASKLPENIALSDMASWLLLFYSPIGVVLQAFTCGLVVMTNTIFLDYPWTERQRVTEHKKSLLSCGAISSDSRSVSLLSNMTCLIFKPRHTLRTKKNDQSTSFQTSLCKCFSENKQKPKR